MNVFPMTTFVFDADGVVCVGENVGIWLERKHGIGKERLAGFFAEPFRECLVGKRDLKAELTSYLAEWGWTDSVDDFLEFWFRSEHVVCADILNCVRSLRRRGHTCVLGTNQEKYRASYMRKDMKLETEFDHVFASCDVGAVKPTHEFFARVLAGLGKAPQSLCLIDDSEKNVSGAVACGWRAIHYRGREDIASIYSEAL